MTVKKVDSFLAGGTFTQKQDCSDDLFMKVYSGLRLSNLTPNFVLNALNDL